MDTMQDESSDTDRTFSEENPPGAVSNQNAEEAESGHRDDQAGGRGNAPRPERADEGSEFQDPARAAGEGGQPDDAAGAAGEGAQSTGHPDSAG